jgi:hypothetical protein
MTDLFNTPESPQDQGGDDALETVKAKFSKDGELDVAALLKAKAEADKFIERLEQENAGVREEMNKRATFDELLSKINERQAQRPDGSNHEQEGRVADEPSKLNPEDIKKMVSDNYNQEQAKAAQLKNMNEVKATLEKQWGAGFTQKLKQVVQDLELTEDEAGFMASSRPKAFLKLVLGDKAPTPNVAPPQSSVRIEGVVRRGGENTYSYYKAMMNSSDPKVRAEYWSPQTQNKIHNLAMELGEAFLKN